MVTITAPRLRCQPVTLRERRRRGHLDGLTPGCGPDVDPLDLALRLTSTLAFRRCTACGRADLGWATLTDGTHTRVWRECRACGHTEEAIG